MSAETLTDFLREPKKALKQVEKEDLVLSRRGKPSIRISLESRQEADAARNELASHLLADAIRQLPDMRASLPVILENRFPWVRFLPQQERAAFGVELVETLQAAAAIGSLAPIEAVFQTWKATAQIRADPDLAAKLKGPFTESKIPVRRP